MFLAAGINKIAEQELQLDAHKQGRKIELIREQNEDALYVAADNKIGDKQTLSGRRSGPHTVPAVSEVKKTIARPHTMSARNKKRFRRPSAKSPEELGLRR